MGSDGGARGRPEGRGGGAGLRPISNCYVFARVMQEHEGICRRLAELLVGEPLGEVGEVATEKVGNTVLARGVRFDAYLEGSGALVDLEMQAGGGPSLELRNACYQAWLTRHALDKGGDVGAVPGRVVVFLCASDPFGYGRPSYRVRRRIEDGQEGSALRRAEDGEESLLYNAAAYAGAGDPDVAAVLEYVYTGEAGGLVADMEDARVRVHDDERWVSDMDSADFDRYDIETLARNEGRAAGVAEGRAAGVAAERSRESALLEAMASEGRSLEEFAAAITRGDRDALYREYSIS